MLLTAGSIQIFDPNKATEIVVFFCLIMIRNLNFYNDSRNMLSIYFFLYIYIYIYILYIFAILCGFYILLQLLSRLLVCCGHYSLFFFRYCQDQRDAAAKFVNYKLSVTYHISLAFII